MLIDDMASRITVPKDLEISDYAIGPKYAYVEVSGEKGGALGLSYFPSEDVSRGFSRVPHLDEIPEFVRSLNIFEKALGVAMLNAVSQYLMWNLRRIKGVRRGNITEIVPRFCSPGRIVVVGNMVPLIKNLPGDCEVFVLERNPRMRTNAYPDTMAPRIIPKADVLIISGAALVNDSIDSLLALSSKAAIRFLVGPTAGITPEITGGEFDYIAGLRVIDADRVKEIIKLGGGRWDFSNYCEESFLDAGNY